MSPPLPYPKHTICRAAAPLDKRRTLALALTVKVKVRRGGARQAASRACTASSRWQSTCSGACAPTGAPPTCWACRTSSGRACCAGWRARSGPAPRGPASVTDRGQGPADAAGDSETALNLLAPARPAGRVWGGPAAVAGAPGPARQPPDLRDNGRLWEGPADAAGGSDSALNLPDLPACQTSSERACRGGLHAKVLPRTLPVTVPATYPDTSPRAGRRALDPAPCTLSPLRAPRRATTATRCACAGCTSCAWAGPAPRRPRSTARPRPARPPARPPRARPAWPSSPRARPRPAAWRPRRRRRVRPRPRQPRQPRARARPRPGSPGLQSRAPGAAAGLR